LSCFQNPLSFLYVGLSFLFFSIHSAHIYERKKQSYTWAAEAFFITLPPFLYFSNVSFFAREHTLFSFSQLSPPLPGYSPARQSFMRLFDDSLPSTQSKDFQSMNPPSLRVSPTLGTSRSTLFFSPSVLRMDETIFFFSFIIRVGQSQIFLGPVSRKPPPPRPLFLLSTGLYHRQCFSSIERSCLFRHLPNPAGGGFFFPTYKPETISLLFREPDFSRFSPEISPPSSTNEPTPNPH